LRNTGEAKWPENTRFVFLNGDALTKTEAVVVPSIEPGEEIQVSLDMVAPSQPGRYVSNFRLCTPDGIKFGHRVWVDILVKHDAK